MIIQLTPAAITQIKALLERQGKHGGHRLRVKIMGGGCSGLQYGLSFDDQTGEMDTIEDYDGVGVIVDPKSAIYLTGSTVDFEDTLMASGFKVNNPHATTTCGCGESFSV